MDNFQGTRKWADLRGEAVVTLTDGTKVGTCDDFYFDPATRQIYAFRVKTGLFGHKILPATLINMVGQDAITTAHEESLQHDIDAERKATLASGEALSSYRVMSAGGTLVGTVRNVLLDTSTPAALRIVAFELGGGLRDHISGTFPTFSAERVLNYGQDVLVIPDEVAQALSR